MKGIFKIYFFRYTRLNTTKLNENKDKDKLKVEEKNTDY